MCLIIFVQKKNSLTEKMYVYAKSVFGRKMQKEVGLSIISNRGEHEALVASVDVDVRVRESRIDQKECACGWAGPLMRS